MFEGTQGADAGEGEGSGTGTDGAGTGDATGGSLAPCLLSRLSVVAAEAVAETVRDVVCVQDVHEAVQPNGQRHRTWKHLQQRLGALATASPEQAQAAERQGNLLAALFASGRIKAEADVDLVLERYRSGRRELFGAGAAA